MKSRNKKTLAYLKLFLLLCILIGLPAFLYFSCRDTLFNPDWLKELPHLIMQNKRHAAAVLIGMQIFQVIVCILPGQPIQLAASYIFGIPAGYLISITGAVIGACCSFYLAKALGKDAVETIFGKDKVENYRRKINSGKGLAAVLLIYLIPGIPKDLAAYAAGISDMRVRPFLIVSTIGRSPAMLGSLMFGHFISSKNYPAIGILGAVTIIILVVCFIKRKALIEMLDDLEKKDQEMYPD